MYSKNNFVYFAHYTLYLYFFRFFFVALCFIFVHLVRVYILCAYLTAIEIFVVVLQLFILMQLQHQHHFIHFSVCFYCCEPFECRRSFLCIHFSFRIFVFIFYFPHLDFFCIRLFSGQNKKCILLYNNIRDCCDFAFLLSCSMSLC